MPVVDCFLALRQALSGLHTIFAVPASQTIAGVTISISAIVSPVNSPGFLPLPSSQFHILAALTGGPRHGYAIMQEVEGTSGGIVRMGPATLYGTLKRLVDTGLIEELSDLPTPDDDARRRYYRLTSLGSGVCLAEADRLDTLVQQTRLRLAPDRGQQ
jgi:DNA-binding PadR family transcriptional regulator